MRGFCENCGKHRLLATEVCVKDYIIKGELYAVEAAVAICPHCLNIVPYEKLDRSQYRKAVDAYRFAHGLLTCSEIVGIRTMYALSQRAIARILGWSQITVHRYEQGGIQNRAHDTVLRQAANDPEFMLKRLELVRGDLSPLGYRRLRECILVGAKWGNGRYAYIA